MRMYRNEEGYKDVVAGKAVENVTIEEKKEKKRRELIKAMQQFASLVGLEIMEIKLRDKHTGKEYWEDDRDDQERTGKKRSSNTRGVHRADGREREKENFWLFERARKNIFATVRRKKYYYKKEIDLDKVKECLKELLKKAEKEVNYYYDNLSEYSCVYTVTDLAEERYKTLLHVLEIIKSEDFWLLERERRRCWKEEWYRWNWRILK